jgi:hypothetical protein
MVGRASIVAASVSLFLCGTAASQNAVGTAAQHEEWSRKFVNGSTTRVTLIDDWDPVRPAQINTCDRVQSVLEATSTRHWQLHSCE